MVFSHPCIFSILLVGYPMAANKVAWRQCSTDTTARRCVSNNVLGYLERQPLFESFSTCITTVLKNVTATIILVAVELCVMPYLQSRN